MAFTLSIPNIGLSGGGTLNLGAGASNRQDQLTVGSSGFVCPSISVVNGSGAVLSSGSLQANDWYLGTLVITAGSQYDFCFNGGADKDPSGTALAFTAVKLIAYSITAIAGASTVPNGVDLLRIGPQAIANTAQLWFGGVGATVYETVYWHGFHPGPAAGWTVNSTTASLMRIGNPGSNNITVALLVVGN